MASSRVCFHFTLLMPLQKRGSPLGQKFFWMKREPNQRTPKATITLLASLKHLLSHSSQPFCNLHCCCGTCTHQATDWNCSKKLPGDRWASQLDPPFPGSAWLIPAPVPSKLIGRIQLCLTRDWQKVQSPVPAGKTASRGFAALSCNPELKGASWIVT